MACRGIEDLASTELSMCECCGIYPWRWITLGSVSMGTLGGVPWCFLLEEDGWQALSRIVATSAKGLDIGEPKQSKFDCLDDFRSFLFLVVYFPFGLVFHYFGALRAFSVFAFFIAVVFILYLLSCSYSFHYHLIHSCGRRCLCQCWAYWGWCFIFFWMCCPVVALWRSLQACLQWGRRLLWPHLFYLVWYKK